MGPKTCRAPSTAATHYESTGANDLGRGQRYEEHKQGNARDGALAANASVRVEDRRHHHQGALDARYAGLPLARRGCLRRTRGPTPGGEPRIQKSKAIFSVFFGEHYLESLLNSGTNEQSQHHAQRGVGTLRVVL